MDEVSAATTTRRDVAIASVAGGVALAIYVRTLAPGLTSDADTPLFQFIGRALGVAHNPGYPLFTLVTWPIAQIPVGELAWRINVFSAVMGAVATGLAVLAARQLAARPVIAFAAALGFATGATFWSQAVIAEVYTLHAALVAGLVTAALAWSGSRRPGHFYAAVGCLAAGLAHHTTILAFAPGLALQALIVDRRFALRRRTLAVSAGILALGLLPYALILVRSRDPQAYVESRATTLGDLTRVILGRQFQDRVFGDGWRALVAAQAPLLWDRVFVGDLTWIGLAAAAIGAGWLLRHRLGDALLLMVGGGIVTAFAVGYAVPDVPVFVIPALLGLWLFAAIGFEQGLRAATRVVPAPALGPLRAVIVASALALPVWLVWQHGARVDRSGDRLDALQVDRLFDVLPPRSAIVAGDFIADRMLQYERLGRRLPKAHEIVLAPRSAAPLVALHAAGTPVFAFAPAVDRLRFEGLEFSATPVPLVDGPFGAFVARLPRGAVVAIAVPAAHAPRFAPLAEPAQRRMGAGVPSAGRAFALVAVLGDSSPARLADHAGGARLALAAGEGVWGHGRADLELIAEPGTAAIRLGGRDLVRTADGVAMAAWLPDGRLVQACALQAADTYSVPVPTGPFSAYALLGAARGQAVAPGGAWADVTAQAETGTLRILVPTRATVEIVAIDDAPLAPQVIDSQGRGPVDVRAFQAGGEVLAPPLALTDRGRHVARLSAAATEGTPVTVVVALGGVPRRVVARLLPAESEPAWVYRVDTTGLLRGPDRTSAVVPMTRDDQARLVGAGWSGVETDDAGPFRWMTATASRLVLPATAAGWRTIRLEAFRPPGEGGPGTIALRLNEVSLIARRLETGWRTYEWTLPESAMNAAAGGSVEVEVAVDRLSSADQASSRGLAVASVRLARDPAVVTGPGTGVER